MKTLILRFLYIGLCGVGGGLSVISLIQRELVDRLGWLSPETLTDILAIAEMTPGPMAVNAASFVGMSLYGLTGAAAATAACVLPGCLISFCLFRTNDRLRKSSRWRHALDLLRAAVTGVIVSGGLILLKNTLWPADGRTDVLALACFGVGLAVFRRWKRSPLLFLLIAGTVFGALRLISLRLAGAWPLF